MSVGESELLHTRLSAKNRTQRLTRRNRGCFGWGRYYYPRSVPHVHQHPRAGYQNGKLCRFWVLAGRCSRRTQKAFGTAMRLCASLSRRRRGPAGLRDLFSFLSKLRLVRPALRAFPCVRGEGWYHYPRSVPHVSEILRGQGVERQTLPFSEAAVHHSLRGPLFC